MKHFTLFILLVTLYTNFAICARILAIIGSDLNSHLTVIRGVVEHLAPFHNITIYTDSSLKYEPFPNVVSRTFKVPSRSGCFQNIDLFAWGPCNIDMSQAVKLFFANSDYKFFEDSLEMSGVSELFNKKGSFDLLLVVAYATEHFYYLAHVLDVPIVQVAPSLLMSWHHELLNSPYSFINDFNFYLYEDITTFSGRLRKLVQGFMEVYSIFPKYEATINRAASKYYPPGTPSITELLHKRMELIFVNTHSVMGYARPNIPAVVEIGGAHIRPPKPLPSDLEEFISGAGTHGFIYFSLGTFVPETIMTESIKKYILNVFSRLPQRVLWKWTGQMPNVPSNVRITKWVPQRDVLGHKNIKLFISHGGMLSMQESVYHAVPVLILPVVFDQLHNAHMAEKKGFGKTISFCGFTEQLFESHIVEILSNSSYQQTMKQMSRAMQYQNRDMSRKINWWIDYVIEHKGTNVLKPVLNYNKWLDVPLDFLFIFTLIIILIMYILIYICILMLKRIIISKSNNKTKND